MNRQGDRYYCDYLCDNSQGENMATRILVAASWVPVFYFFTDKFLTVKRVEFSGVHDLVPGDVVLLSRNELGEKFQTKYDQGSVICYYSPFEWKKEIYSRLIQVDGGFFKNKNGEICSLRSGYMWVENDDNMKGVDSEEYAKVIKPRLDVSAGAITKSLMVGSPLFVVWPPNRIGLVKQKDISDRVVKHPL